MSEIKEEDSKEEMELQEQKSKYGGLFEEIVKDLKGNKLLSGFKNGSSFFRGVENELYSIEKEKKTQMRDLSLHVKESVNSMKVGVLSEEQEAEFNENLNIKLDESEEELEDYGKEVHEILYRSDDQILEDAMKEDGLSVMVNGGAC
jgi:hypothetical protein